MLKKIIGTSIVLIFCIKPVAAVVKIHYDNVLGTSMDISIAGASQQQAEQAVNNTLNEIQRLGTILSTWREDSQISVLNQQGNRQNLPDELIEVIAQCEKWHHASHKTFSCRMGKIKQRWLAAEQTQTVPDRVEMRYQARALQRAEIVINTQNNSVELDDKITLDPAGLAKGYIIDTISAHLRKLLPHATGLKVDIGGDAYYWGQPAENTNWHVAVADPVHTSDIPQHHLFDVSLSNRAIASSGHNSRFRQIQRRKFSHILDPHDGWPMDNAPSAIVIAKDAISADAIATALSTQPAVQGIDWVNQQADIEALIVLPNGLKVASTGWHAFVNLTPAITNTDTDLAKNTLHIAYQIPTVESVKYHQPYVAIWISDRQNRTIRNLLLLGESNRWAKENTRWWHLVGRKNPELLDGLARPTRRPGHYNLIWDGLNDFGKFEQGFEYYLHVEAAREAGGHDYQRIAFTFNPTADPAIPAESLALPAKGELGTVTFSVNTTTMDTQPGSIASTLISSQ